MRVREGRKIHVGVGGAYRASLSRMGHKNGQKENGITGGNYDKDFWIAKNIALSARRGQVTAATVRPIRENGDTVILKTDAGTGLRE